MRLSALRAATPRPIDRRFRDALTRRSDLGGMIARMISTQSLAAFTPAIGRAEPVQPVRGPAGPGAAAASAPPQQRVLEAVPAQPAKPMPRGSLLDLRV